MSTDDPESFQAQLESVYQRYRHRSLESRLEEIADTMERTVLQRVLAEAFLQTEVQIDTEAKQAVQDAKQLVETNQYEKLAEQIDELEQKINDQEGDVHDKIQETRIEMSNIVNGMVRLNKRVDRVDEEQLEAIKTLLDGFDWEDEVYQNEGDSIEALKDRAESYGRDMRRFFEDARDQIFGPYSGTPLEPIVGDLLGEERLSLADLSDEQIELLRDSDLESYVELKLS